MNMYKNVMHLTPHTILEAADLFFQIREHLHVIESDGSKVIFAFSAQSLLADRIAELESDLENDEDDGTSEPNEISSQQIFC